MTRFDETWSRFMALAGNRTPCELLDDAITALVATGHDGQRLEPYRPTPHHPKSVVIPPKASQRPTKRPAEGEMITFVDGIGRTLTQRATLKWPPAIDERYVGKWPPKFAYRENSEAEQRRVDKAREERKRAARKAEEEAKRAKASPKSDTPPKVAVAGGRSWR